MDLVGLVTNLISGAVGGNLAGAGLKDKSLGAIGNTVAGLIGGVAGDYIIQAVDLLNKLGLADMSAGAIAGQVGTGAISGAILTAIVAYVKNMMGNKS